MISEEMQVVCHHATEDLIKNSTRPAEERGRVIFKVIVDR